MPVSKGRKKKSKSKKSSSPTRVFENNGIKISQKGNMTYIQNKRSEKEQKDFIEGLKENRPVVYEKLKSQIQDVIDDIQQYDKITLLGIISSYMVAKQFEDDGKGEVTLEYAQSICLAGPNDNKGKLPTYDDGNRIIGKLIEIRTGFSFYYGTEQVVGKNSEIEHNIRYPMILESLFVRGDGYIDHLYEVFNEIFAPHDEFLGKNYGFKASDIIEAFQQFEDSFCTRIVYPNKEFHPAHRFRWEAWKSSTSPLEIEERKISPVEAFAEDNPDLIFEDGKPKFFWLHDRTKFKDLFTIRTRYPVHDKVMEALGIQFGDNREFLNPSFQAEPLNDSKIFKYPIVFEDGSYYLFGFNIAARNLIKIGENLLKTADKKYFNSHYLGNKYKHTRDNYLERKVEKLFENFLPDVSFYPGVKYSLNSSIFSDDNTVKEVDTELDLLGVGKDAIYLIEIKAGELNESARRGAIKSLTNTLRETVGYAAFQSYRAEKTIRESERPCFVAKDGKEVIIDKHKKSYRISVSLDHLGGLMTNLYDLKELDIIAKDIDFAWAVSLYDLMIFSEILENEGDFKEYLDQRINLYKRSNIEIPDEISLLGYFLKEGNIKFDGKKINNLDTFKIEKNYSSIIDEYFHNKLYAIPTSPPRKKR